jgi:hypothetical protein
MLTSFGLATSCPGVSQVCVRGIRPETRAAIFRFRGTKMIRGLKKVVNFIRGREFNLRHKQLNE